MSVILASGSPRRRELLEMLKVKDMKIIPAQGEEIAPDGAGPAELVQALALEKAREVAGKCDEGDVIIAADTIVWARGKALGKPQSRAEAISMLKGLSDTEHEVYTGIALISRGTEHCESERTKVRFRALSDAEIEDYVDTGEPMDKAGAYGAQGMGALFVKGIEGDFFNVMGLPLCRLGQMLRAQGIEIF